MGGLKGEKKRVKGEKKRVRVEKKLGKSTGPTNTQQYFTFSEIDELLRSDFAPEAKGEMIDPPHR
jgi:hypothetical protein